MDFPLFPFDTFPNGEKVSIFLNISELFGKEHPSCGSLCIYVETKQGWSINGGDCV